MAKTMTILLLLAWTAFGQQIFLSLDTDIKHADVTIIEQAMSEKTYRQLQNGVIKESELPMRGNEVKRTTPLRNYRIGSNQIIRLIVKKKGFYTYNEFIKIGTADLNLDLRSFRPKSKIVMTLKNMFIPGWGQYHTDRGGAGFGFIALEVIIGGAAGYCYYTSEQHYDDFLDYRSQYETAWDPQEYKALAAKRDDAKEQYENFHNYMNYAIYAAGAVWLWSMLDGFINAPGKDEKYAIYLQSDRERVYASISISF